MNHPILTHLLKSGSAIAGTTGPAHAIQGTTGNGPLANPVTLSTTGPLNSGAGTGVIGSRLPQGGTTANPANEQPAPIDPAELDKAKLQAQQAQTQVQQAKAQQEMQKIESDHASKMQDMSGGITSGFLQNHMSGLDTGLNKLLNTAMKSRLQLGLAKRAAEMGTPPIVSTVPQAGQKAPTPVGYKPLTRTRTGAPIAPGATPDWVHDGTGGVVQRNLWEAQQQSRINNLNAGNTAEGAPRPGAFAQDMAHHYRNEVIPALRGEKPIDRDLVPLGPLDGTTDKSLAKWSPAWAVNRATTWGGNLLGSTFRGVGGSGARAVMGIADMGHRLPGLFNKDTWNKPVSESPFLQSTWHTAKNVAGTYLNMLPGGAALTGGANALEQYSTDSARAKEKADAIAQAAEAQKAQMGGAAGAAPTNGNDIMSWLSQMGSFLAPYTNTDWMRPHPSPVARGTPSQIGAGGHAVRDLSSFIR